MKKYQITRLFTGGLLKGIEYTEVTSVFLPKGFSCEKPCGGGSPYKIIKVITL